MKDYKIALVLEHPNAQESGSPMQGTSGELLRTLLSANGILASNVYVTYAIKTVPTKTNKGRHRVEEYYKPGKWGGNTSKGREKLEDWAEELRMELEALDLDLVIPLGPAALHVVCGEHLISNWRGSVIPSTLVTGLKALPSLSPYSCTFDAASKFCLRLDLRKAMNEVGTKNIQYRERITLYRLNFKEACDWLDVVAELSITAVDIETIPWTGNVTCIGFSLNPYEAICIQFQDRHGSFFSPEEELHLWRLIKEILENPSITKIIQNIAFEQQLLLRDYGIVIAPAEDTMGAFGILYPDLSRDLGFMSSLLTDLPYHKTLGKYTGWLSDKEEDDLWKYNCLDCCLTHEIWIAVSGLLKKSNQTECYRVQLETVYGIQKMQQEGIAYDPVAKQAVAEELERDITEAQGRLEELVGKPLNVASPKQMKEYFYGPKSEGGLALKPYLSKKEYKPTTDDEALKKIHLIRGIPAAGVCREIRKLRKMNGSYISIKLDADERYRGGFGPFGTTTGRFNCKKTLQDTGCNLQTFPKQVKKLLVADPGHILVEWDLARAENMIVAYCAPVPKLIRAYEDGIDTHKLTASLIYNIPIDQVSAEPGSSGLGDKSQRDIGKFSNHSLGYGLGGINFARKLEIPVKEGKLIRANYHRGYPEIEQGYQAMISGQLWDTRSIINPWGFRRPFMGMIDKNLKMDANAHFAQSTVAGVMNRALGRLWKGSQGTFKHLRLQNQVHDSLWAQIPISIGAEAVDNLIQAVHDAMIFPLRWKEQTFTIPVDVQIGHSYGELINYEIGNLTNWRN